MTDILIVIFTGVVALSTVFYACLTCWLVIETRKIRQVQTEPRVSVRAEINEHQGHGGLDLVIRNEGQGAAQQIRFEFQGDPTYFDKEHPVDQLSVIKNGLPYLGPNQEFRFLMGWLLGESFTRSIQSPWTFRVNYDNQAGQPRHDTFVIDFSQFAHLIVGGGSPLYKIERHLQTLQRDVHHLSSGFYKLQVITQTKEETRKKMEELINERGGQSAPENAESTEE